jgi:hypothetical protein
MGILLRIFTSWVGGKQYADDQVCILAVLTSTGCTI